MTSPGFRSVALVPKLSILETSRSIRRALITSEDSPLSGRKCSTPTELPVSTRSRAPGDDNGVRWTSRLTRLRWFGCFILATFIAIIILGSNPLSNDWKALSLRCSSARPSNMALNNDEQSSLPSLERHSQDDDRFRVDGRGVEEADDRFRVDGRGVEEADDRFRVDGRGGEEDETCWSRTRHWMYRPSKRHFPPSPSLSGAFEKYESLHARCTAGKKWERLSELTESEPSNDSRCKYLIYIEGIEGLGNRFMSLVTAFTYALITDRVLLLDNRRNMSTLICEPFQGSSWTLPPTFPVEKLDDLPSLDDVVDGGLDTMAAVSLNLRHVQSEQDQRFFCSDVQERLGKVPLIGWKSNQYYVPRLYMMPQFWEKLNPLFSNPSLTFTQLSRVLLLPQNAIWAKAERAYRAYLGTPKTLVGMQVRSPQFNTFEQPIYDRIVQCLVDDHVLPTVSQQIHKVTKISEEGTAIFVASLQREYYAQLKEVYAERGAEDGTLVTVHTMAAEAFENLSFDQSVTAFVDMLLLSFSDSLLTSGWSTFGYVAQGMGAVLPHIVNTDVKQQQSCDLGQSLEPCTHFPYLSSCPATSTVSEHGEWMKKHLRPCQDQPAGIQLVAN